MWSINDLQEVWQFATRMHDGQKYGGTNQGEQIEYINHIASVAFEIMGALRFDATINSDLALKCALLHDTLEDTSATYEILLEKYGQAVADGVQALTKNDALPTKEEKMADSLRRIKMQPKEVWAVKMADRICNLYAAPYYWTPKKKQEYVAEAKIIHAELKSANTYLAERLGWKIEGYLK